MLFSLNGRRNKTDENETSLNEKHSKTGGSQCFQEGCEVTKPKIEAGAWM